MISTFSLRNFKCHRRMELPVNSLTLLTGLNAAGKSSAIQGALLISQALRANVRSRTIPINGQMVRLGTAGEISSQESPDLTTEKSTSSRDVLIGFSESAASVGWFLGPSDDGVHTAMQLKEVITEKTRGLSSIPAVASTSNSALLPEALSDESHMSIVSKLRDLSFLSAARVTSQELFPSPDLGDIARGNVGTHGEYAAWWLTRLSEDDIDEARWASADSGRTLRRQLNAWGAELFPGFEATSTLLEKTGLVQLQLRTDITHEFRKPANVGFGLSYVFPLLVAGLTIERGQVLVIDSPEAHLHPRGQSRIGRFLAVIAASGVQVIVETHSDHVLNGIRVAVKDEVIAPADVTIHFFGGGQSEPREKDRSASNATFSTATIDNKGRLSAWPAGFFDQIENDLAQL